MKFKISKDWIMAKAHLEDGMSIEAGSPRALWLDRCAARFCQEAGLPRDMAMEMAESQLENLKGDITESPEQAADDEMSYWTAD